MKGTCSYFVLSQVPSRFSLSLVPRYRRYTQFFGLGKKIVTYSYLCFKLHTKSCSPLVSWLACVASTSGSVRFGSKERETRVKDHAKNGTSRRAGNRSIFRAAKPENPVLRRSCFVCYVSYLLGSNPVGYCYL